MVVANPGSGIRPWMYLARTAGLRWESIVKDRRAIRQIFTGLERSRLKGKDTLADVPPVLAFKTLRNSLSLRPCMTESTLTRPRFL